tara:strand:- start:308 stop:526 length:219 start_codon:yes stop_codon:yes gene_type:complete|eukprot:scaffold52838_cov18-Phaeocystis_antarctica.AAC.1
MLPLVGSLDVVDLASKATSVASIRESEDEEEEEDASEDDQPASDTPMQPRTHKQKPDGCGSDPPPDPGVGGP